jgi:lysophospholipase L1-like esterase
MSSVLRPLLRAAAYVSPPFAIGIAVLALSKLGVLTLDPRIQPRGGLVISLLLYWGIAAFVVAAACNTRAIVGFVRARRAPLTAATISLVISLFIAEQVAEIVVARTQGFKLVPSATLHHENPRNASISDNTGVMVHTNPDGLRTRWTRESFRTQRERIVVMGDSFTFGLGVEDDESVPANLQDVLRERLEREDVGVLNAGVISYSPFIQREVFREVVSHYAPTLTILMLDLGDVGDDYKYAQTALPGDDPARPRFDVEESHYHPEREVALLKLAAPILVPFQRPFDVVRRFQPRRMPAAGYLKFEVAIDGVVETDRSFILRHPLEKTRPYFEATLSYVREIAREARAVGSEFVLVVPPRYFQWSDRECPKDWAAHMRDLDEPHEYAYFEFFDEVAHEVDFPIKSLLPEFRATDKFPLVFENDAHWNPDGNRFVAEAIADYLSARGLVGAAPR